MGLRCLRGLLQHEQLLLRQTGQAAIPRAAGHLGKLWARTARVHVYGHLVLLQAEDELP